MRSFPPSPRSGIRGVYGTRGLPGAHVGRDGDLATDPTTGKLYAKSKGVWAFKGQGFNRLFFSQSGGVDIYETDPPFFHGASSYLLSAQNAGDPSCSPTVLTWTFPEMTELTIFDPITVDQLILQRSTTTRSTPTSATGDGTPDYFNLHTVEYSLLPVDAAWTTLTDLRPAYVIDASTPVDPANYALLKTYTDNNAPDHIFNYRLIMMYSIPVGITRNHYELDWNVVTVTKPYSFVADGAGKQTPYVDAAGIHLAWA